VAAGIEEIQTRSLIYPLSLTLSLREREDCRNKYADPGT
jgi:hypothetical protein